MKTAAYSIVFLGALSLLIWLGSPWQGYAFMIGGFILAVSKIESKEEAKK